ncbi:MAG TPA: acylneuraminate cytidylyltransferase family protein [Candidatus Omnitrophota bacterium]|nr:acylneuraminate cytidylyltransferase family protein [Candidatus Omnitrophota bacterium]
MDILCIIPARGGSKGVKNKNIKPVLGKPLIAYTIEAALKSKLANKVVVSTDGQRIAKAALRYGAQVIKRPKKFATDTSPIEDALRHTVKELKRTEGYLPKIVVSLQANNPIRKNGQIDEAIKKLINSPADSVVTVYPVEEFPQWMKRMDRQGFLLPLFPKVKEYRRQEIEPLYLDGSIAAIKTITLMKTEGLRGAHLYLGKRVMGLIQDKQYTLEIHHKEDFAKADLYLKKIFREGRLK